MFYCQFLFNLHQVQCTKRQTGSYPQLQLSTLRKKKKYIFTKLTKSEIDYNLTKHFLIIVIFT